MKVKDNIKINTIEAITKPSLRIMTSSSIVSEELLARDTHTHTYFGFVYFKLFQS